MATGQQEVNVPKIITSKLAVMAEVKSVRKDRYNKHQRYEYVGHDDVTEALQEAFVKYSIVQRVDVLECKRDGLLVTVHALVTWISGEDGSQESVNSYGETTTKASTGRPDSVEVGAAVSYAVKTAQLKNFMLVGGLPDNEERDREEEAPARREEKREERRDPKKSNGGGVADEEVERWCGQYARIGTQDQLDEQRLKLKSVVKLVNDDQYERLKAADAAAVQRVAGEAPQGGGDR